CGGAELPAQACAAKATAESLAAATARDGHVIYSRAGVPRTHPAVKDELQCRAFVCRTLERLGISIEAVKPPGRPPSGGLGWSPPRKSPPVLCDLFSAAELRPKLPPAKHGGSPFPSPSPYLSPPPRLHLPPP